MSSIPPPPSFPPPPPQGPPPPWPPPPRQKFSRSGPAIAGVIVAAAIVIAALSYVLATHRLTSASTRVTTLPTTGSGSASGGPTAPVPGNTGAAAPGTTSPGGPGPASDPWSVVYAYYNDIGNNDYSGAWDLLSASMQSQLGPESKWESGYSDTCSDIVAKQSESGTSVDVRIDSGQCDGTTRHFSGSYTVSGGKITSASITAS